LYYCNRSNEAVTKKTAHEISHERAELRHKSRIPAWQQQEQKQEPVILSRSDQQAIMSSIIAGFGRQKCDTVRRCVYCIISFWLYFLPIFVYLLCEIMSHVLLLARHVILACRA